MKKALIVAIFIFSFLIPLVAEAQPEPPNVDTLGPVVFSYQSGNVIILSPKNSSNYVNQIQLIFAVEAPGAFGQFGNVGVSLDGGVINSVTDFIGKSVVPRGIDWYWWSTTVLASIMLPTLSEGTHNATVYYGWQYLGTPENPSLQRYEVFAHATVDFMVVNTHATNVSTAVSDITSYTKPEISIISPQNMTFNVSSPPLNFTVSYRYLIATNASVCFSMDGKDNVTIFSGKESLPVSVETIFIPYNLEIDNLSDGLHNLTVYAEITYLYYGLSSDFSSVQFTIDTSPPRVLVFSPENKTYDATDIQLDINVDESTSQIEYCLDGQDNVTLASNMTLTGLSIGVHNVTVYAWDTAGNIGASPTIYFTIANPAFGEENIPTAIIATIVIVLAFTAGFGLLIYFKRRHR
jgi:hypothetical protein